MEKAANRVGGVGESAEVTRRQPTHSNPEFSDPVVELHDLHRRLDTLAARLMWLASGHNGEPPPADVEPEMDIYENDREFLIHAAMPGAAPQNIRVDATAHTLTLSAETPPVRPDTGDAASGTKRHRRSRYSEHERYHCVYTLHTAIHPDAVRATFRHGIVEIHLPKAQVSSNAVSVPVILHEEGAAGRPSQPDSAPIAMTQVVVVTEREGNPSRKLGAAYAPNAGEDHATKAQSIGEQPAQGRSSASAANLSRHDEHAAVEKVHTRTSHGRAKQS